jgi:hypothetical protein
MTPLARLVQPLVLGLILLPAAASANPPAAKAPATQKSAAKSKVDRALLERRVAQLRELQRVSKQQAAKPAPTKLGKQEADAYTAQTKWLAIVAEKATVLEREISRVLQQAAKDQERMAQMNMQFLALQEATQAESRRFRTLASASKARHDIVMGAIRNEK